MQAADVVAAATALDPQVRAAADDIEQQRRLPAAVVAALADAGVFRMCVPRSLGGLEVDPAAFVAAIERLSVADGSAGWCVMIGATTGLIAAYLDPATAHEIYGEDPNVVTGGVVAPMARGSAADGGFRVTGRWPFGSGSQHSAWLVGGFMADSGGAPRLGVFPRADVEILDTWTVSGLRGTGSHDFVVDHVFVPASRHISLFTDAPRQPG